MSCESELVNYILICHTGRGFVAGRCWSFGNVECWGLYNERRDAGDLLEGVLHGEDLTRERKGGFCFVM